MMPDLCREDGRVSFGYSTLRGKRASMEDFLQAKVDCASLRICLCPWCLAFGGHELSEAWCMTSGDDSCVQFSQHPTNGSTVGFFGVFDGERSAAR